MNNLLEEDDLKNKKFFRVVGTFSDKDFIFFYYIKMWMLLCRPIIIPTNVPEQTMISTDKCRIVTVSPTNDPSRYVIDMPDETPEILIKPDKD